MKMFTVVVLLVASAVSFNVLAASPADRVLIGGDIETMNPKAPKAEALAMKDGKIVFVGSSKKARSYVGDKNGSH